MGEVLEFTIALKELVSASAFKAGQGVAKLTTELGEAKKELGNYQAQLARANALGDIEGHRKYAAAVAESKRAVFELSQELETASSGPMARFKKGLGEFTEGAGEFALAIGAVAVAGVALTAELVHIGLETAEVNEKLTATFEALGDGPGEGKKTLDFLNELATELPQSRTQLADWAKQYQALGITDLGELRQQIQATASAQAIMGDQGAEAYKNLTERIHVAVEAHTGLKLGERTLKQLYAAGLNVTDVSDRMGVSVKKLEQQLKAGTVDAVAFGNAMSESLIDKGVGPLEAMGKELGTLLTKGKETFGHLFDDIDASPITDAIKSVIDLGDQGEPSGQALKTGVTSGINAIIKDVGEAITQGEIWFLKMELGWLRNKKPIAEVTSDVKILWQSVKDLAGAVGTVFGALGKVGGAVTSAIGAVTFGLEDADANAHAKSRVGHESQITAEGQARQARRKRGLPDDLAPHASGGIVESIHGGIAHVRPAHGEGLVSIGAGEQIIPAHRGREVGSVRTRMGGSVANDNGGGHSVHIEHLHIEAPGGVTHVQDVTVVGLTLALERLQLASGR